MAPRSFLKAITDVIWPRMCAVCGDTLVEGENVLCMQCLTELPRTNLHTLTFSEIHQRLATTTFPLERAAAWFYYTRGARFNAIIHDPKYNSLPSVGVYAGQTMAQEWQPTGFFDTIDIVTPIPLSTMRLLKRGYNQAHCVAQGISRQTSIPVVDLLKAQFHQSLVGSGIWQRWQRTRGIFAPRKQITPHPHHILLVDDVITSGATMIAALETLHHAYPQAQLSVCSVGLTL